MTRLFSLHNWLKSMTLLAALSPTAAMLSGDAVAAPSKARPVTAKKSAKKEVAKKTAPAMKCEKCGCALESGGACPTCMVKAKMPMMADMRAGSFVYTLDNDATRNGLAVYRRGEDGALTMLPGSPFQLGGKGLSGGDIDEQGAVRVHGSLVLAVNPGSNTIAVLRKSAQGLLHVEGSPFPSGGSTPLSLAVHGDLAYVANQAAPFANPQSLPNITGFRISAAGQLEPLPNSTIEFPKGEGPAQIEFNAAGTALAATSGFQADGGNGSRVHAFRVMKSGRLTAGMGSPAKPEMATGTVGFSWNREGTRLYVSTFKQSGVLMFDVDPATAAIKQAGNFVSDDQRAACWTAVSPDGKALYVGNFVSNSVSVYAIEHDGSTTLLGSVPRRGATNMDTKDIEISADGKFLYAIGSGKRQISVFRIEANRLLTELPPGQSPVTVPSGQNITGLVVD